MRDWEAFVRERLALDDLTPAHATRVMRELAAQLEDACADAVARGLSADDADALTQREIADWSQMAADVRRAFPRARAPRVDRAL